MRRIEGEIVIRRTAKALVAVDAFAAVTAVGGGIALATGLEEDRFPATWLMGTPFRSYRVPGLLLAGLVGGGAACAAASTLRSPTTGGRASLLAGAVLMCWIGGETRLLKQPAYGTCVGAGCQVDGLPG